MIAPRFVFQLGYKNMRTIFFICSFLQLLHAETLALYLTWYEDPSSTMTIQWHSPLTEPQDKISLETEAGEWLVKTGSHIEFASRCIHKVQLEGLDPDSEYAFRIINDPAIYKFKTAPRDLSQPLRFFIGGDAYQDKELFRTMSRVIVHQNPLFVVIGGDIAHAIKNTWFQFQSSIIKQWFSFLRDWKEEMISPEGKLIPFILVPGNHDIKATDTTTFFSLFAFPEKKLYRTIDFSKYLQLVLLDTNNLHPIIGKQTAWLEQSLSKQPATLYRFAVYHTAAYPSYYPFSDPRSVAIRSNWSPLFEKYNLPVVFEHHNHTFKRTFPIKEGKIDESGIVYLGDGCWGIDPREPKDAWYLAKKESKNHVYMIELNQTKATIEAIDLSEQIIDRLEISPTH